MNRILLVVLTCVVYISLYATENENALVDSVITLEYKEGDGYENKKLTVYEYYENGEVKAEEQSEWNKFYQEWQKSDRYEYSEKNDSLLDRIVHYYWANATNQWQVKSMRKTVYDTEGRVLMKVDSSTNRLDDFDEYVYENGKLVKESGVEYGTTKFWEYDDSGRLLRFTQHIPSFFTPESKDSLVEEKIHTYTDTIEEIVVKHWQYAPAGLFDVFEYNIKNTYNSNNQLLVKEGTVYDCYVQSGVFTEATKETYAYGENGELTEKLILKQLADSDEWEVVRKVNNSYYENGELKDSVVHKLNQETSQMDYVSGMSFYENGNAQRQIKVFGERESFTSYAHQYLSMKREFSWKEHGWFNELWMSDSLSYSWTNYDSPWGYSSGLDSVVYEWDENGNETMREKYSEEPGTLEWYGREFSFIVPVEDDEYTINERYKYEWDSESTEWIASEKLYMKNKEGYEEYILYLYNADEDVWGESTKDVNTESESFTERLDYIWDVEAGEWIYSWRYVEEYDEHGSRENSVSDGWNAETQEWEISRSYKYINSYFNDDPVVAINKTTYDVKVYPSVFNSELTIEAESELDNYKISLVNSNGVVEYSSLKKGILKTSHLSKGVYFIVIERLGTKTSFCVKKQ